MSGGGFGRGPFGRDPFGEWKWARQVLFDSAPDNDRDADGGTSQYLDTFARAWSPLFNEIRKRIRVLDRLRDPLLARSQYDEVFPVRLGKVLQNIPDVEQRGLDGLLVTVPPTVEFRARTGRFKPEDVGKQLLIRNSSVPANNQTVSIFAVVDNNTVLTDPVLQPDAGPFRWELRTAPVPDLTRTVVELRSGEPLVFRPGWLLFDGLTQLNVKARFQFPDTVPNRNLFTEREGPDATFDNQGRVFAFSYSFTQMDVGKILSISGAQNVQDARRYEIIAIDQISPTDGRAVLSDLLVRGVDSNGGVHYRLRFEIENVRVEHQSQLPNSPLDVVVVDHDITVKLATDSTGAITTTANALIAALNATPETSDLIVATVTGTGTGVTATFGLSAIPGRRPKEDPGPLYWALLPRAVLVLDGPTVPRGVVEQDGLDAAVTGTTTLPDSTTGRTIKSLSAKFTDQDIGKIITLRGSTNGNDGSFVVMSVVADTDSTIMLAIRDVLTVAPGEFLTWELRPATRLADTTSVSLSSQPLLPLLANDFGVTLDRQEPEDFQRRSVDTVSRWIGRKGTVQGYANIGQIADLEIATQQLFRISQDLLDSLGISGLYEVGEGLEGRYGYGPVVLGGNADGSLILGTGGRIRLSSPTALFKAADVGVQIRIGANPTTQAAYGLFNKLYTIDVVSSQSFPPYVEFRPVDAPLNYVVNLPDANNGSLDWAIVRLYADIPPRRPNLDEVNADLLEDIVDGIHAEGSITAVAGASLVDGQQFVLNDGINPAVTFEFDSNGSVVETPTLRAVPFTALDTLVQVRDTIKTSIEAAPLLEISVVSVVPTGIWLRNDYGGVFGNQLITETVSNVGFVVTGMTGGTVSSAPSDHWSLDKLCSEPDFVASVAITVLNVTVPGGSRYRLSVNGPAGVALAVGQWKLVYADGSEFFVDSVPAPDPTAAAVGTGTISSLGTAVAGVGTIFTTQINVGDPIIASGQTRTVTAVIDNLNLLVDTAFSPVLAGAAFTYINAPPFFTFDVISTVAPTFPSPALLVYSCPIAFDCSYCGSYRQLTTIEAGLTVAQWVKTLDRIDDVKPAHVDLVPEVRQNLSATLVLRASGTTSP